MNTRRLHCSLSAITVGTVAVRAVVILWPIDVALAVVIGAGMALVLMDYVWEAITGRSAPTEWTRP